MMEAEPGGRVAGGPSGDGAGRGGDPPDRAGTLPLRLAALGLALAVAAMAASALTRSHGAPEAAPSGGSFEGPVVPSVPPDAATPDPGGAADSTARDTLRAGETLSGLLREHGLGPAAAALVVELVRPYADPRSLRPGVRVTLSGPRRRFPAHIALAPDRDRTVHVRAVGARWTATLDSVPVRVDTVRVTGRVETSLYAARVGGDARLLSPRRQAEVVHRLSRIFAWKIDFWRDVRRGDEYRAVLERSVRPDGSTRDFRILAADYRSGTEVRRAIRFQPADGDPGFYDEEGASLRAAFLRAPLEFARVTSRFSRRRYHPVLRTRRPHLGVDYGAAAGTPVRATGAGRVTRAGWWGQYGKVVEIRHPGGIRTRYAHLSRIGVRPGQAVDQGAILGRVGSTGLSTAPHLHYEFLQRGRPVDPGSLDLPAASRVSPEARERFRGVREAALALLTGERLPGPALARDRPAEAELGDRSDG